MENTFISCDWGTSSFRLRLITGETPVVSGEVLRNTGIRDLFQQLEQPDQAHRDRIFGQFLTAATEELIEQASLASAPPIMLSGMASSTIGWRELPYSPLPFNLDGSDAVQCQITLDTNGANPLKVHLISGVASDCEIMRGEECELIGLATLPQVQTHMNDCLVILPGTHSKHVRIREGRIVDFSTHMTGELFDVLAKNSVLASTVQISDGAWNREAFAAGVRAASQPGLMPSLFQTRTRSVLHQETPTSNASFLSGLLIGAELSTAIEHKGATQILLTAGQQLSTSYAFASELLNLTRGLTIVPPNEVQSAAIRGHAQLISHLRNSQL